MTSRLAARQQAVAQLNALAERHGRAVQSFTRMIARLATEDAQAVVTSIAIYVNHGMPDAEAVADIATLLEGSQPPEWQAKRAKQRQKQRHKKLQWQFDVAREMDGPESDGREILLASARRRRDVIAAALAACEQDGDEEGRVMGALCEYLQGNWPISGLEGVLQSVGLSVPGAAVIPFIPRARRS